MIQADNQGLRYNKGKAPIHLIPPEALIALAGHYQKGADKYKERNWERGMKFSNCYNSLMRHALAWWQGEDKDPETGTHHMVAVAWNAIALFVYYVRGIGEDDRVRYMTRQPDVPIIEDKVTMIAPYHNVMKPKGPVLWPMTEPPKPTLKEPATGHEIVVHGDNFQNVVWKAVQSASHWGIHDGE